MKNALFVVMALFAIGANAGTIKITDGAHMVSCVYKSARIDRVGNIYVVCRTKIVRSVVIPAKRIN